MVDAVILIQAIRSRKNVLLVLVADAVILMAVCGVCSNHDCADNADNDGDEHSNRGDNARRSSKLACTLRVRHCVVDCQYCTHNATQHFRTCIRLQPDFIAFSAMSRNFFIYLIFRSHTKYTLKKY